MVPNLSTYLYPANNSLAWNNDWISEFESAWSVINKIMYANNAVKKDIFNLFGTSDLLKQRSIRGSRNHNIYLLTAFEETSFIAKLGFSLKAYNSDLIYQLSGFLSNREMVDFRRGDNEYRFWRKSLTFCIECLKDGYHSILHQFSLIHECPFHGTPLHEQCPNCFESKPYELSDLFLSATYICSCGNKFRENQSNITPLFQLRKYSICDIQDERVKTWINLSDKEQFDISRIYLYRHIDFKSTPQILEILLSTSHSENNTLTTYDFYQISSPKNILKRRSKHLVFIYSKSKRQPTIKLLHDESNKNPNINLIALSDKEYINLNKIINENIYEIRYQTIQAIGKHLRKTVLKNHKSCIHRYVNLSKQVNMPNPPICPYAYTYVKWKQRLLKIDDYYDVDNSPYYSDQNKSNHSLTSYPDWDPLVELIWRYLENFPVEKTEYHNNLNWVVSHLIGYLILHYFYELLQDSAGFKKFDNIYLDPFILRGTTLAFRFPKGWDQSFQLLWDKKPYFDISQIQCPYPTQKLKRKKVDEVSHHPLRIAINRADRIRSHV